MGSTRFCLTRWGRSAFYIPVLVAFLFSVVSAESIPESQILSVASDTGESEMEDPLEDWNRACFDFNLFLDQVLLEPLAQIYEMLLPSFVRQGIHNALSNLKTPLSVVNFALQGDWENTVVMSCRFLVNSTIGMAGVLDVASELGGGLAEVQTDLGTTLDMWGLLPGPYLVLPFLGPTTLRDCVGSGGGSFLDPVNIAAVWADQKAALGVRWGLGLVDQRSLYREDFDDLKETSLDLYTTVRNLYYRQRQKKRKSGSQAVPGP